MSFISHNNRDRFITTTESMDRELLSLQLQASKLAPSFASSHYSTHLQRQSQIIARQTTTRAMPSRPDRVLDAPGLIDDFYLNLLDWSTRNILAVALGSSVYLWNGSDGSVKELMSVSGESYISSLSWIHDGKSIAVGTSDGCAQIWDIERSKKLRTILASPGSRVGALSWYKHLLSTGSKDGSVLTHDVRVAKHLISTHCSDVNAEICGLSWSPDGKQLAAGSNDNRIQIWNSLEETSNPQFTLEGHRAAVKALSWCPWKGNILASGGGSLDRSIRLWNTSLGDCIEQADTNSAVSSLLWSQNSREIVSSHGVGKNHLGLWKVDAQCRDLQPVATIDDAHDSRILHMSMSPDGKLVASASADESIKFWSLFNSHHPKDSKKPAGASSPFSLRTKSFR